MFEIIRNILTTPIWTIGATIILWRIFLLLFTYFKLSDTNWKRLEYIWIFTGILGLVAIVDKNNKEFRTVDSKNLKPGIQYNLSSIQTILSESSACFKYIKSPSSPEDFDDRQHDQDLFCDWARTYTITIDSIEGIPTDTLETTSVKRIKFKTTAMDREVRGFLGSCSRINAAILKFYDYNSQIKSNELDSFGRTVGLLLLIIAFAIRLSIATRNVLTTKAENKKKKLDENIKQSVADVDEQSRDAEENSL